MANHNPLESAVLDRTFAACSHPIRRGILERLTDGELSVAEATGNFGVSKPAISRHLKVLEEAGAIVRVIDGRTHRLRIQERRLREAAQWMSSQRELWERKLDTVEEYLREQRDDGRGEQRDNGRGERMDNGPEKERR